MEVCILEGYSAVVGSGAAIRIVFEDPGDWQWALDIWRSLRRAEHAELSARCDDGGMYVPAHFKPDDDAVAELLANIGAADLITATADGLLATMLPLVHEAPGVDRDSGRGAPPGARRAQQPQWSGRRSARRWSSSRGPDAYISPAWYATKREHGRVVPTWNYITAHVHGRLVVHDDPAWVEANVRALTGATRRREPSPGRSTTRRRRTSRASSRRSSGSRS